ncbi:MAG: response regulator transcription factor [candidate division WOR-3 bacterium]
MSEKKKILIVEDEANLRELVKARLEENNYEVITVADGFNAITQSRKVKPDLIILDLMIPHIDGYAVCRVLKSTPELSSIPVIMFTARTSMDDLRRGMEMGADAYLMKPFKPEEMLAKIRELLERRESPPEAAPAVTQGGPVGGVVSEQGGQTSPENTAGSGAGPSAK